MKKYRYLILLVFVILVFILYPLILVPIKNTTSQAVSPLTNGLVGISDYFSKFFDKIRSIRNLSGENIVLKNENMEIRAELEKLKETDHQNQVLKEELGFVKDSNNIKLIPAQIISYSPSSFLQTLKLNKGKSDGIENNLPVISHGYLIGIVNNVSENSCDVYLITNSNSLISVILSESRGTGLLAGGLQGMSVKEIPSDTKIKISEAVLTSGLGGDLPGGIPVGSVEKITSSESEFFQTVSVKSPVSFGKLEIVFILGK